MADVTVTFDADLRVLNQQIEGLQKTGERAGRAINKPMEKLLEGDKRVERSVGNLAAGFARAQTSAEGLVAVLDNLENAFNTPLYVGAAAAIGVAINQTLEAAARGANAFSSSVERLLSKDVFASTTADVEAMREQLRALRDDAGDDGLLERWIFGSQKQQLLEDVQRTIDQAATIARNARVASVGDQISDLRLGRQAAESAEMGDAGGARWIQQQLRQAQEMRKAEEELQKLERRGSQEEIAAQRELMGELQRKHSAENKALDVEISKARYRKQLETELNELETRHQYELLGLYTDREKLEIQLVQAQEKVNLISANRGATEKEINAALIDQAGVKFQLVQLEEKEAAAIAEGRRSRLERSALGKNELDQQRLITNMAEQEARGAQELAETAEERQKAEELLTNAAKERVKLLQMERDEAKRVRDIEFERAQLQNTTDPFGRAEAALQRSQQEAGITRAREDASKSEIAQATLEVLKATRDLLEAAAEAVPSVQVVASAGDQNLGALRRSAFASGASDPARARQAIARGELATAVRARDPFGAVTRARSDRLTRQSQIQALQAQDVLPDELESGEARRLRGLSDQDFANEVEQRRLQKEQSARAKDTERARREDTGIDAFKKRQEEPFFKEEEAVPAEAEQKPREAKPADPMQGIQKAVENIDKTTGNIEKKLPTRALTK